MDKHDPKAPNPGYIIIIDALTFMVSTGFCSQFGSFTFGQSGIYDEAEFN
ncbi:hypothetical protein GCM10007049_08310 [Echinicola pacifica]|uniref:Uncharacterized protein n=1 Tax=Echinicola pacifica TaxID=346377 RepID=A0A918PPR9_9BACT|nr:hypothetical protein [Echinicola pacifica]GGZ18475.1 hypothetical protein GCM10007049_08310 [Echinicola pacifica]